MLGSSGKWFSLHSSSQLQLSTDLVLFEKIELFGYFVFASALTKNKSKAYIPTHYEKWQPFEGTVAGYIASRKPEYFQALHVL